MQTKYRRLSKHSGGMTQGPRSAIFAELPDKIFEALAICAHGHMDQWDLSMLP